MEAKDFDFEKWIARQQVLENRIAELEARLIELQRRPPTQIILQGEIDDAAKFVLMRLHPKEMEAFAAGAAAEKAKAKT